MLQTDTRWDETSTYGQLIKSIFRIMITWMKIQSCSCWFFLSLCVLPKKGRHLFSSLKLFSSYYTAIHLILCESHNRMKLQMSISKLFILKEGMYML